MRRLAVKSCLTDEGLKAVMESQKTRRRFKDYQIICSAQTNYGKKAEEIASMLGVSKAKVLRTAEQYNRNGTEWEKKRVWGGRQERWQAIKSSGNIFISTALSVRKQEKVFSLFYLMPMEHACVFFSKKFPNNMPATASSWLWIMLHGIKSKPILTT